MKTPVALHACSWEVRALWPQLMAHASTERPPQSTPLVVGHETPPVAILSRILRLHVHRLRKYLRELELAGLAVVMEPAGDPPSLQLATPPVSGSLGGVGGGVVAFTNGGSRKDLNGKAPEQGSLLGEPGGSVALVEVRTHGNGKSRAFAAVAERGVQALAMLAQEGVEARHTEDLRQGLVDMAFAYWAAKTGHTHALLDPKRVSRLRSRLTESRDNINELLYAVDGCLKKKFMQGHNESGEKYDGVQTVFRDREQVERLAELGGYRPGKVHPQVQKYIQEAAHV